MQNNKQDKFDYKNIFSMKNKKVVILGGTGNLGLNFSRVLSSAGAKVYLLDKIKKKIFSYINYKYHCIVPIFTN